MAEDRRSLKILHIDTEKNWGGGETQVLGLLSYLSLKGHHNHLLCHPGGRLFREAKNIGIEVSPLIMRNDLDLRPVLWLRRWIAKQAYDIVHFHTKRGHSLSLWLGRRHPGLKYVVTRRMDYPVKRGWYTDCLYNRRVDGVVAISEKIASLLVDGGVRPEKIRVIHSGVDPAPFELMPGSRRGSDRPVVGTAAVLEERKGHRFLLQAAALLKRRGLRLEFLLAGDGSARNELENEVRESGLQDDVSFLGFVADIPRFLSGIDVFVLPSLYEGLGVAALEAMAAGKPVIATRVGGLPELVEHGVTGFLVPPRDSGALADSIGRLVAEEGLAGRMGKMALQRVREHFTLERMAKRNEDYYREILRSRSC